MSGNINLNAVFTNLGHSSFRAGDGDWVMPQIWMTYAEIADLLGCEVDQVHAQVQQRSLDRKNSRDGITRVKLDLHWTAKFYAALRGSDPALDQAIRDLLLVGRQMARDHGQSVRPKAIPHENGMAVKNRA
jgi:hypothetical protein